MPTNTCAVLKSARIFLNGGVAICTSTQAYSALLLRSGICYFPYVKSPFHMISVTTLTNYFNTYFADTVQVKCSA
jgi:hypothetical protein